MKNLVIIAAITLLTTACGASSNRGSDPVISPPASGGSTGGGAAGGGSAGGGSTEQQATNGIIRVNQLGFTPNSAKIAVAANTNSDSARFEVINQANGSVAMSGELASAQTWEFSDETVNLIDFTSLTTPGDYYIRVNNIAADSAVFSVGNDVFDDAHAAVLKAYYFNRASTALEEEHAGVWARSAGHPDTNVIVAENAASATRPANSIISAPKGWYDAGDYNKYVVNSGISTYTLLAAYEHYEAFYTGLDVNIPESGDSVPDILDEVKWNLDWLVDMQDDDGGVYHKLTHENFSANVMPSEANTPRYVVQKSTSAALNFAATMAVASRVFDEYETEFPGLAAQYRSAALNAYTWAQANSNIPYGHTFSRTGEYGDTQLADEFSWAAAELFILTGDTQYWDAFSDQKAGVSLPSWQYVAALPYISLAFHADDVLTTEQKEYVESSITNYADSIIQRQANSAYRVPMFAANFNWGGNANAANHGMIALQAYRITGEARYKDVAIAGVDYLFGRNATGFSFVTGHGDVTPVDPHHRQSVADSVVEPVPGFLVGGANEGRQDGCANYIGVEPALSYVDDYCSYASNEVTINWNAPLVYVLGALIAEQ